jgi:hypothetical protein
MAVEKTENKESAKDQQARRTVNPVTTTLARAHLECIAGPEKGQTFRCAPTTTVVGRDTSCDVALTESVISRQHLRIERRGETWVLRNLSANGTRVNKKTVDEAVLADGDDIRLGAKTRLKFVVETVTPLVAGRPQFRPRAAGQEEDEAAKEAEGAEEGKVSLFKRRKSLFIGIGVWVILSIGIGIFGLVKSISDANKNPSAGIPILAIDDMIIPADGGSALRVISRGAMAYSCEYRGARVDVPFADILSGRATYIRGMRKALEVKFLYEKDAAKDYRYTVKEKNEALGAQYKAQAMANYRECKLPGKEAYLFGTVRSFQRALAYYGARTSFVDDSPAEHIRQQATQELLDKVKTTYDTAITYEKAGDPKRAWNYYGLVLKLVPERENPICENVAQRMSALKAAYPDMRF